MKRSEMIWDLASEIIISGLDNGFDIAYDKAQDMADKVLKRAEKEGMLPPKQDKQWPKGNPEINENWRIWEDE